MARYLNDQAKVVLLHESGTYGIASGNGVWPGQVQSHSIPEKENIIETRYLGQGNRNVGQFNPGPIDVTGNLTLFAQDWRFLGLALGSITTTSGTAQTGNYRYDLSEVNSNARFNAYTSGTLNPFISFTLEESRTGQIANQNSMRTIKGCNVDEFQLKIRQSDPVVQEVKFIGQSGSWFSGTSTTVTADTDRPYLWSDAVFSLPDAATQESVKELTFSIKNNFVAPHYVNGSRVIQIPYPLNRDYKVEVTQDLDSSVVGSIYQNFYKGGSQFNAVLDLNNTFNTGSNHLTITFSGCKMEQVEIPAQVGGISEITYSFVPGSVSAIAHDNKAGYTAW